MTEQHECTSSSGHRWTLGIDKRGRDLSVVARCVWQECGAKIEEGLIESRLNATEKLSAFQARDALEDVGAHLPDFFETRNALLGYADTLESKDD